MMGSTRPPSPANTTLIPTTVGSTRPPRARHAHRHQQAPPCSRPPWATRATEGSTRPQPPANTTRPQPPWASQAHQGLDTPTNTGEHHPPGRTVGFTSPPGAGRAGESAPLTPSEGSRRPQWASSVAASGWREEVATLVAIDTDQRPARSDAAGQFGAHEQTRLQRSVRRTGDVVGGGWRDIDGQ